MTNNKLQINIKYQISNIKIFVLCLSLVFLAVRCNRYSSLSVNGHNLKVELAETSAEQKKGLSGRDSMPQDNGMIFLFDKPDPYAFWMKDMSFPLDFIWIKDNKVLEITRNVPSTSQKIYKPSMPVDSVLEVNAGWTKQNGIKIGDSVDFTK